MSVVLRNYQLEAVEAITLDIKSRVNPLCVLTMGAGKTEIMIETIKRYLDYSEKNVVVLLNKVSLLEQTIKRIKDSLGGVSVYCGSLNAKSMSERVTIATVQSVNSAPIDARVGLIVIDEVHNLGAAGNYKKFIENNKQAIIYGTTATPFRTATGIIYGPEELFKKITYQKSMLWMIEEGYLVKPMLKKGNHQHETSKLRIIAGEFNQKDVNELVKDQSKIKLQITDALERSTDRKCFVWACASIEHCDSVYSELLLRGETVVRIHSEMSLDFRYLSEDMFRKGNARHLVFVSIVAEGFDHPPIDCVVLMRPIRSPVLYVQICGRGLRRYEDKEDVLILDYGKVIESIGPLDNPKIKFKKRSGSESSEEAEMKACKNCLEYVPRATRVCPVCDYEFFSAPRDYLKNLDAKAKDSGSLLSSEIKEEIKEMITTRVLFSKHESKNGNDCIKISYYSGNIFEPPLHEYFVWNNEWAFKKLLQRMSEMKMELSIKHWFYLDDCLDAVQNIAYKTPLSVLYKKENGFNKVTKINA